MKSLRAVRVPVHRAFTLVFVYAIVVTGEFPEQRLQYLKIWIKIAYVEKSGYLNVSRIPINVLGANGFSLPLFSKHFIAVRSR